MEQSTHEIRVKEWSKIIQNCYTSGLTKKEWCVQNHINEKSFYYWQRVIRKETLAKCPLPSSDVQTTFVELPSPKFSAEAPMNEPAAIYDTYFKGAAFTLLLKYNKVLFLLGK